MSKLLYEQLLNSGDLRGIDGVDMVVKMIDSQAEFDILFSCLKSRNRLIVMRTADAIEKITKQNPQYLEKHKVDILQFCSIVQNKELKWHLAQLVTRIMMDNAEFRYVCNILEKWATDTDESKICRVNALQSLFELYSTHRKNPENLIQMMNHIEDEDIPSLNARIRHLKNKLMKAQ
jgi:hypothetical protein